MNVASQAHPGEPGEPAEAAPLPRKKKALITTGRELFMRYGVKRVTVEEVCREASVSKGTFYKYFSNKNDLVKTILTHMTDKALARTARIQAMEIPFAEKVRMMVDDKLESTRRTGDDFFEEFFHSEDEELAAFAQALLEASHRRFCEFIVEAQKRGEVDPELRPEFVLALLDKLDEMAADESLRALYPSWYEFTREVIGFFFYGLLGRRPPDVVPELEH